MIDTQLDFAETNGIKSLQPLEYYSRSYTSAQKNY